ncbi:MAG: hypothetical protein JEZ03_12545 [Bacteroidales bacterium]|nr:hypothetical protein [Bacteroidales bacterium]
MSYTRFPIIKQSKSVGYNAIATIALSFILLSFVSIFIPTSNPHIRYFTGLSLLLSFVLIYCLKFIKKHSVIGCISLSPRHIIVKNNKTSIFSTSKIRDIKIKLADFHGNESVGIVNSIKLKPGKENFLEFTFKQETHSFGLYFNNEESINDFNRNIQNWRKKNYKIQLIGKDNESIEL